MFSKPFYSLYLDKIGLQMKILVNDIPLCQDTDKDNLNVDFPINHYLVPGLNHVKLIINIPESFFGEKPFWDARISLYLYGAEISNLLGKTKLDEWKLFNERVKRNETTFPLVKEFDLEFVNPSKGFDTRLLELKPIKVDKNTFTELFTCYNEVYQALDERDQAKFISCFTEKNMDISKVFYKSYEARLGDVRFPVNRYFTDDTLVTQEINIQNCKLGIYFLGCLLALEDTDGDPIIALKGRTGKRKVEFPVYYAKIDGKYVIIR